MSTAKEVRQVRATLKFNVRDFARLLNVDQRSVNRWEAGSASPSGTAHEIITALNEQFLAHPETTEHIVKLVNSTTRVGGLGFLLIQLFKSELELNANKS